MNVLESNGRDEARAYAVLDVPAPRPEPPTVAERVLIADPRATSPVRAAHAASGPRNADQKRWPPPPPPAIELPDGRPATEAQRVHVDPELVARWRAEAKEKERA